MGCLDLEEEGNEVVREKLSKRLRGYGLVLDPTVEAEVHGPHGLDFNYKVWIVWARTEDGKEEGYVAIYPRRLYWLEDSSDWWKCETGMKIDKLKKK